ncbi:hypothetical protein, partial [Desulfonatronospira sp.]|uniref:hypothetical protein n=1 Tax=Desulfonatronospira sp. TaxID=1962951 RepID=UPI0025C73D14
MEKFGLDQFFWEEMTGIFGYYRDKPNLHDLLIRLLANDLAGTLKGEIPDSMKHFLFEGRGLNAEVDHGNIKRGSSSLFPGSSPRSCSQAPAWEHSSSEAPAASKEKTRSGWSRKNKTSPGRSLGTRGNRHPGLDPGSSISLLFPGS